MQHDCRFHSLCEQGKVKAEFQRRLAMLSIRFLYPTNSCLLSMKSIGENLKVKVKNKNLQIKREK